jgi:hypothetical protein
MSQTLTLKSKSLPSRETGALSWRTLQSDIREQTQTGIVVVHCDKENTLGES